MRTAICACGRLSVRCAGEPTKVSLCHCLACQRQTGSTYNIAAFFKVEDVAPSGQDAVFTRTSDSGHDVTLHFCPSCGSTVWWRSARKPELVAVGVGGFADPAFPPPEQEVYSQHRHPWVSVF